MSVQQAFNQAAKSYNQYGVLQQNIAKRLFDKLTWVQKKPDIVVDLGAGTGFLSHLLLAHFDKAQLIALDFATAPLHINQQEKRVKTLCANAYQLPLADSSVDIITSNLMLQWCQAETVFKECYRVLKTDGLFIFSTFGPDTLQELRQSWASVDKKTHVNHFQDMHTLGDLLLKNHLIDPVMEMEIITLTYDKVFDLMLDLKGIGANYVKQKQQALTGKKNFNQMVENYEIFRKNGKLPASYEVIYGHAFKRPTQGISLETTS